ncbi:MAG: hypothetical protein U0625_13815 [Phycisphaerales bacterium]
MCFGDSTMDGRAAAPAGGGMATATPPDPVARRRRSVARPQGCAFTQELARAAIAARGQVLAQRTQRIDELVAQARERGEGHADREYWTLIYDLEMAPSMTGRGMLLEQQLVPVPPQDLVDDAELHDELWTVIEALAASGVFLVNTDHLCDRDLYARLFYKILDEPTRCLPPDAGAVEFIDVLHPLDVDAGGFGARLAARLEQGTAPDRPADAPPRARGPFNARALADRDRWLPRPGTG